MNTQVNSMAAVVLGFVVEHVAFLKCEKHFSIVLLANHTIGEHQSIIVNK